MAKVLIFFEDTPNGLQWGCSPTAEELLQIANSGHDLSNAQFWAISAMNYLKRKSNDIRAMGIQKQQEELMRKDFVEHVNQSRNTSPAD